MPMDYHGLSSRASESICSCAYVCTCVRARSGNPGERTYLPTYLSTGNKLTSCRKLANVPWEDSAGGTGGGGEECGRRFRRAREQETLLRTVPKCEFDWTKPQKPFYPEFIIHDTRFSDKCTVIRKNNGRDPDDHS